MVSLELRMNEELILALGDWLEDDELDYALNMFEAEFEEKSISNYINRCLTKKEKVEILDRLESRFPDIEEYIDESVRYLDNYPPSIEREMEYKEYIKDLPPEDAEYVKQFYHEHYANGGHGIDEEDRILKTEEMFKEATRITNARNRDAYSFCENTGHLQYIEDQLESGEIDENDLTWQELFTLRGYAPALDKILIEAEIEIKNKYIDNKTAIVRAHLKLESLRRMNNRDIRTRRSREK